MSELDIPKIDISYPKSELNPEGNPLKQQKDFHQSRKKFRMLEGGWGTGKTSAICIELSKDIAIPGNYILFGRKDLQEFKSTTLKEFLDIYETAIVDHNKQDRIISFNNGTQIYYTNLDDAREALNKIASLNLGCAVVDQCEEISRTMFETIKGRLRRQKTRRCFYGAANPNGHDWIFEDFFQMPFNQFAGSLNMEPEAANKLCRLLSKINYLKLEESYKKYAEELNVSVDKIRMLHLKFSYQGWVATSLDNPYLPNDTLQSYMNLPDQIRRRYVYCSFDDFTGEVYNEFSYARNKIPFYTPNDYERRILVLDYGYRNPTAVGFFAIDYDGVARLYDEIYLRETLIHDIAEEIKKREPNWRMVLKLADPSIWNVQKDGTSVADDYYRNEGLAFIPAPNDVSQGINRVNQLLKDGKLLISEKCTNWFWERDRYKWKDLKPGQSRNEYEEPVKKDDHLMDLTRYFANYTYAPKKPETEEEKKKREEKNRLSSRMEAFKNSEVRSITDFGYF